MFVYNWIDNNKYNDAQIIDSGLELCIKVISYVDMDGLDILLKCIYEYEYISI